LSEECRLPLLAKTEALNTANIQIIRSKIRTLTDSVNRHYLPGLFYSNETADNE